MTALISSTVGAGGATILGKTVVSNMLKVLPIVGGAISAATAATITDALGYAYIGVMEMVFKGELDIDDLSTTKGKEVISEKFNELLKRNK